MSDFRRRLMMVGKALPYDAEIEYLESTGTQWINTGIKLTNNFEAVIKSVSTRQATRFDTVLGASNSTSDIYSVVLAYSSSAYKTYVQVGGGTSYIVSDAANTTLHKYRSVIKSGTMNLYVDDSKTPTSGRMSGTFESYKTLYLFARNTQNGTYNYAYARMYYCKLYVNDSLVRDFIPVRKDGVGYMYDKVSGQLFGNAGTGNFILGPDI